MVSSRIFIVSILVILSIVYCKSQSFESFSLRLCLGLSSVQIVERGSGPLYLQYCDHIDLRIVIRPKGFLLPQNERDVQAIVKCATVLSLNITIKSGGHNFEHYGYGSDNHWVIYLRNINYVNIDTNTGIARVGAGTINKDLIASLVPRGYYLPVGTCLDLGVAGFTLGGGIGFTVRPDGLMLDQVREMRIVLADSTARNTRNDGTLQWALLGAGAINYGIVTEFTFNLLPLPPQTITFTKFYTLADFATLFPIWQQWCESDPDEAVTPSIYWNYPVRGSILLFGVIKTTANDNKATLVADIKSRFPSLTDADFTYGTYADSYAIVGYSVTQHYWKLTSFFSKRLTPAQVNTMITAVGQLCEYCFVFMDMMRGRIRQFSNGAWVHRNALYSVLVGVGVPAELGADNAVAIGNASLPIIGQFLENTQSWDNGESYQNYVDGLLVDWSARYYGNDFVTLLKLKDRYDPHALFRCPQCFK